MSLFSKSPKPQPSQPAPVESDPILEALKLQNEELKRILEGVSKNVTIVNDNVRMLIGKVNTLQSDMHVSLGNDRLMEQYFQSVEKEIKRLQSAVNNLSK